MLFSVPQQDRTTLFHLSFSGLAPFVALVLILWASTAPASRLAIGLQHARPHLAEALKRSVRLMDTIALLFALSPVLEKEFLVPSMAFITANAYDIVCRLDRDDTLDDVPQNKKQKIATGLLLDILHKQDFAGPLSSRVSVPWDRSVVIVLLTSCTAGKLFRVLLVLVTRWFPTHPT